jgi:hypothetical protein
MSCLFESFSYFIKENRFDIRQKICDYLQNNQKIIDGLDTKTILEFEDENYIDNMRNEQTQGGAIEIQVACNIWNILVDVRDTQTNKNIIFYPFNTNYNQTIYLEWNGCHYEPIRG